MAKWLKESPKNLCAGKIICAGEKGRIISGYRYLFWRVSFNFRSQRFILVRKDLFSRAEILRRRQEKKATHKECVAFLSSERCPLVLISAR